MNESVPPTILVIIGITGDLSKRKLLPALYHILNSGTYDQELKIVGISRRAVTTKDLLDSLDDSRYGSLSEHISMYQMNLEDDASYIDLKQYLNSMRSEMKQDTQILFYLSVPPEMSRPIIKALGKNGFQKEGIKLLLEKPFGTDYTSATEMALEISSYFSQDQIYRIDHYMAKDMAQNIVVFRNNNALLKHIWNGRFIERIEIIASETLGIEGRSIFYEQTGALRDVLQNHLMQLVALTLMTIDDKTDWETVPNRRLEALRQLTVVSDYTRRGQYDTYATEVQNSSSVTETFTAIKLSSSDPIWADTEIILATGKAMAEKTTEVRLYVRSSSPNDANIITLRLQPNQGLEIDLWSKKPGYAKEVTPAALTFDYEQTADVLPEAYEQVIIDAIRSDSSLFTSADEILQAWKIIETVQTKWSMSNEAPQTYPSGTDISKLI